MKTKERIQMKTISKLAAPVVAVLVGLAATSAWASCGSCGTSAKAGECKDGACAVGKDGKACCEEHGVVNTAALATLIRTKVPVTILDARSGKYDDGKRVPGARQLSPAAKDEDVAKALPDKQALIVTYCAGPGCPASKELAEHLEKLGYTNVIEYPEGIPAWIKAGNTVEQAAK